MPSFPFHSRLAETWIARFRDLASQLACHPRHREAWRWEIQVKILTYLILRYGPDPRLDERCAVAGAIAPVATMQRMPSDGEPLRSRTELRQILERIAEINRYKII
jgi:hypothetical protein